MSAGLTGAGLTGAGMSYTGLVTRGIAFAIDAAVINLVATIVGVGASLILALLHLPGTVKAVLAAIGTAVYVLWLVGYFVVFWSTTGQTLGARVMQFQVETPDGGPITPRRAVVRCAGLFLAALPLFLGFLPILYDNRRRGFQDRFAGTVVVNAPAVSMIEARRARKRAEYLSLSASTQARPDGRTGFTMGTEPGAVQPNGESSTSPPDLLEPLRQDDPPSRFEQGEM
jgi:uncharacterized RDD family membrane protein YckC